MPESVDSLIVRKSKIWGGLITLGMGCTTFYFSQCVFFGSLHFLPLFIALPFLGGMIYGLINILDRRPVIIIDKEGIYIKGQKIPWGDVEMFGLNKDRRAPLEAGASYTVTRFFYVYSKSKKAFLETNLLTLDSSMSSIRSAIEKHKGDAKIRDMGNYQQLII